MAKTYYKQCTLEKKTDTGYVQQTSWIPEKFSKVESVVKIKDDNGEWVDGWVVKIASDERLSEKELPDSHNAAKAHRKATGDSSPR